MKEKRFFQATICLLVLLCLTSILVSVWTAKYAVKQFQVMAGNLYQDEPEMAEQFLKSAFESEISESALKAGEDAAIRLGYTEAAYDILYKKIFPQNGQLAGFTFLIVLSVGICILGLFWRRYTINKVRGLWHRVQTSEEPGQAFRVEKNAESEWISLEYEIARVIEANQKRKQFFEKRQGQMQLFMENLAHQIKTPLACILLNLELLQDREEEFFAIENKESYGKKTRSNVQ